MEEQLLYGIKDKLSGYMTGIPFSNIDMAIRYFKTQLETNPIMQHNPSDFELYFMGTFNPEKGTYSATPSHYPELVQKGE